MIMCIQCSMKAMVEGKITPYFDGTMEEHMAKYHPDYKATQLERIELMDKLTKKFGTDFGAKE